MPARRAVACQFVPLYRSLPLGPAIVLFLALFLTSPPVAEGQVETVQLSELAAIGGEVLSAVSTSDGQIVVYLAEHEASGFRSLYAFDLVNRTRVRLNEPGQNPFNHQISPDDSRVIYQSGGFYSVALDGTGRVELGQSLPPSTQSIRDAAFSPDGSRAVFMANPLGTNVYELFSEPIAGGFAVKLSVPPVVAEFIGSVRRFDFAGDPARVVYTIDSDTYLVYELYSAPIGGGPSVKLSHALDVGSDPRRLYSVATSGGVPIELNLNFPIGSDGVVQFEATADSSRVLYRGDQFPGGALEIFTVPVLGGPPQRIHPLLTLGGSLEGFTQTADGARVIYWGDQDVNQFEEVYAIARRARTKGSTASLPPAAASCDSTTR